MSADHGQFQALVLAGERPGGSAFSRQLGLASSVLAQVVGRSSAERVVRSVQASHSISQGLLVGPSQEVFEANPQFAAMLADTDLRWIPQASGPSSSVLRGLQELDHYPVFITAADHALLTPVIIDAFCRTAAERQEDIVVGLVPYERVKAAFPATRRTVLKFRGGQYCGSNLFAIRNSNGQAGPRLWRTLEADRKRPWRMVRRLGPIALLRYLTRTASLGDATRALADAMGCSIGVALIDEPRVAIDVDSVADLELAEHILKTDA